MTPRLLHLLGFSYLLSLQSLSASCSVFRPSFPFFSIRYSLFFQITRGGVSPSLKKGSQNVLPPSQRRLRYGALPVSHPHRPPMLHSRRRCLQLLLYSPCLFGA